MSGKRKVLLLTGASRGIGHATVKRFSDAGWRIITCSRDAVPPECKRDPNWTHHITADLADPADLEHFVAEAGQFLDGALHALVNNAGVSPKATSKERLGVLNGDLEDWHRVFQLNFFVPLNFARIGVRVNAVAPGEIETAMLSPETTTLLPRIPLNRLGIPSDVAGTIFFLCSEDAAYVTGTEISVNGGQHIY